VRQDVRRQVVTACNSSHSCNERASASMQRCANLALPQDSGTCQA
jgi:hypothetical protein